MIDYIIVGIIVFSIIVSLLRGFVREVLSLASWIVAIAILFVLSLIVGAIVNYVIGQLVDRTGLSGTDRVLGACFGFLRGVLIVAAILFFLDTFTGSNQTDWWKESKLIPHFRFVVDWFFQQIQANSSFLNSTLNLEQVTTPASNPTPTSTQNQ